MSAMGVIMAWPPVTRVMVVVSFTVSLCVHLRRLPYEWVVFWPQKLAKIPPELWRLPLPFLITDGGFSIIFDPYFLLEYGTTLERRSSRFSELGSFFVYIIFNGLVILALDGLYLGQVLFMKPFVLALAFTVSQDEPEREVHFLGIISMKQKYLPYAMMFATFLFIGPDAATNQAVGIVSAHMYDFLTRIWPTFGGGTNMIKTPLFVKHWFAGDGGRPAPQDRGFGSATPATNRDPLPQSWSNQRGPGRRLGGE